MSFYIKRILLVIALIGVVVGFVWVYRVYAIVFSPNTHFSEPQVWVYIPTGTGFEKLKKELSPLLKNPHSFDILARKKGYHKRVKPGKYAIVKGMNNNQLINRLRNGNAPVNVSFNNQETLAALAGKIARQIEADSSSLYNAFTDGLFLRENGFNEPTALALYVPNTYQFFWNTSAEEFRQRMLREYHLFWNARRLAQAEALQLTPQQVTTLAAIVQKETTKVTERPRVAGVYLNRLREGMLLQADPTVIYAIKKHTGNFDTIIKRVLYKDLALDSPYNTYRYGGLPPGPISMPDISSIDAVLQPEKHEYYYFVANVDAWGYHTFARTLEQHTKNKEKYVQWLNKQQIRR